MTHRHHINAKATMRGTCISTSPGKAFHHQHDQARRPGMKIPPIKTLRHYKKQYTQSPSHATQLNPHA